MDQISKTISLNVVSKAGPLAGLDAAHAKMIALSAALDGINQRLQGLTSNAALSRSEGFLKDFVKGFNKGHPILDIGKQLGYDVKALEAHFQNVQHALESGVTQLQNKLAKTPVNAKGGLHKQLKEELDAARAELRRFQDAFVFDGRSKQYGVGSVSGAAKFFGDFQKSVIASKREPIEMLRALFSTEPGKGGKVSGATGPVSLVVPPSQIMATLGPGTVPLVISPGQIAAAASGVPMVGSGSNGANGTNGGGGGGGRAGVELGERGGEGRLIERRIVEDLKGERPTMLSEKQRLGAGRTLTTISKMVEGFADPQVTQEVENLSKGMREQIARRAAAAKIELERAMGERDPRKLAESMRKTASALEGLTGGHDGGKLEDMGLGEMADKIKLSASKLRNRARKLERQFEEDIAKWEEKTATASQRSINQYLSATGTANERSAERRSKAATNVRTLESGQAMADLGHRQARQMLEALKQQGYTFSSEAAHGISRSGKSTRTEIFTGTKEEHGNILTRKVRFDFEDGRAAGARLTELTRQMKETRNEAGLLGGDFIRNTAKVMTWAASVHVMQAAVGGLEFSMRSLIDIGPQMARLDQTFKGVGGNSHQLTMDILALASAEGRGREEAMEAAIQWSRLGLTRAQVGEATRASLMAANIAQLSAGEATEHLSAIYNAYGLRVGELRTKLSELNSIALAYNVTNRDMLEGLSRSSAVARQAKVPLEELAALIGATVGATGQTGANIGNAMKTFFSKLSSPGMQQRLHDQFKFEVRTSYGNEIKNMSQVLAELYVRYQRMSDAQRQSLLYQTAGATQTSRITAMLDNYIRAQTLAITAQLQLTSAEQENAKVKATLKSQLQGIVTEWERFINVQSGKGGAVSPMSMLTEAGTALHNVMKIMNAPGVSTGVAVMLPLFTALGARIVLTKLAMEEASGRSNILLRSFQKLRATGADLSATLSHVVRSFHQTSTTGNTFDRRFGAISMGLYQFGRGRERMAFQARRKMGPMTLENLIPNAVTEGWARLNTLIGRTARLIAGVAVAARSFFMLGVEVAAIGAGLWVLNRAMDFIGASSERAEAKMAGFNAEAEKAAAAGQAAAQAFRLFETAQRALPNMRKFEDRQKLWKQISDVAFPDEANSKERPKTEAFRRAGLEALNRENGLTQVSTMLQERKLAMVREEQIQRQLNFEALQRDAKATEEELNRLAWWRSHGAVWVSDNAVKELEAKQESLKGKKTENLVAQSASEDDYEKVLEGDQMHLTNLEKTKTALQAISELYRNMRGATAADRYVADLAALQAEGNWIKAWRKQIQESETSTFERRADEEKRMGGLDETIKSRREELARLKEKQALVPDQGEMPTYFQAQDNQRMDQLNKEIERLEAEKTTLSQNRTMPNLRNMALDKTLIQKEQQNQAERKAKESADYRRMIEMQTRMDLAHQDVANQIESANYGVNEGDRWRRRLEKAGQIFQEQKSAAADPSLSEESRVRALAQAQAALVAQENMRLEIQRENVRLQAQEKQLMIDKVREFQRGMMMAGPGELLRKLAAFRLTGNGGRDPKDGLFFAMSPEMRGDVMGLRPGMDPSVQMVRRAQEALKPYVTGAEKLEQTMMQNATEMSGLLGQLSKFMKGPTEILDSAGKVTMGFMDVVKSSGLVTEAMGRLETAIGKVEGMLNNLAPRTAVQTPTPVNPQTGGSGGADGHVRWLFP